MKPTPKSISIVVPTLNEVGNLRDLTLRLDAATRLAGYGYELIIIDDHSSDGTPALAQKLARTYPIRCLVKMGEKGKAQSLLEGFAAARYELVAMIDADLQYPPEALVDMLALAEADNLDVVLTRRTVNETSQLRKFVSFGFNFLVARALHGVAYDTQSGLKLFRRSLLNGMTLKPSPWSFDLEFIVRARQAGAKFGEVEITFAKRTEGEAKINFIQAIPEVASASLRLKFELIREQLAGEKGYQS